MYAERNSRLFRVPASDRTQRFSSPRRTKEMRSHVQKGRSVVTGSSRLCDNFPRDCPLAPTASLALRTRRVSPLLAGFTRAIQLPDKEFRYLRTVIVTAAVYRGLDSRLRPKGLTSPRDLPAPGRRQPLYVVFRLRRDLCFW